MLYGSRYVPHKMLTISLFGEHPAVSRYSDGVYTHVRLHTSVLRRHMRISAQGARLHLKWLQERGFIRDLVLGHGRASFICRMPSTFNWTEASEPTATEASA